MEATKIKMTAIEPNKGQVEGLPANPRLIKDEKYRKLKKSIEDDPEMLELRELLVYPHGGKFVIIGGNMRYRAMKELGYKEAPCKVIPAETPVEKLRAYTIKDNNGFGEYDFDLLANEWDTAELEEWGTELPVWDNVEGEEAKEIESEDEQFERMKKEFADKMANGELSEDDEEYQEFLAKFEAKKTTDDCYTPQIVYDAVADWVANKYGVSKAKFVRPFYPGGDYQKEKYAKGCVVVDNPPFSILAEILRYYDENGVNFFLFAPKLTLFSGRGCLVTYLPTDVCVTYENGANVNTAFITNLDTSGFVIKSEPTLHQAVDEANRENLKSIRKQLPKYYFPKHVITSSFVGRLSQLGIEFNVPRSEAVRISELDSMKERKKTIYGGAYLVSDHVVAEREKAEREKAEREKAEREKADVWVLSDRERAIVQKLNNERHE